MQTQPPQINAQPNRRSFDDIDEDLDRGGSSTYADEEKAFLSIQIDVSDLLDDFEHRVLRGEKLVVNKEQGSKEWVPISADSPNIINEIGIRELLARIMGKVTKIGRLTWKEEEEIYKDMFYFDMSISELIAKRCETWKLDMEVAKAIKDEAVELVWDVAAGSRKGFTAINLRSQYSRSDVSRTDIAPEREKSFLGIKIGK